MEKEGSNKKETTEIMQESNKISISGMIKDLKEKLAEKDKIIKELKEKLSSIENLSLQNSEKIKELKEKLANREKVIEELKETYNENLAKIKKSFENFENYEKIKELKEKLSEKDKIIEELKEKLNKSEKLIRIKESFENSEKIKELKNKLAEKDKLIEELKQKYNATFSKLKEKLENNEKIKKLKETATEKEKIIEEKLKEKLENEKVKELKEKLLKNEKIKEATETLSQSKDRIITGIVLILGVALLLAINNFYLIWAVLGAIYLLAVSEMKELLKIEGSGAIYSLAILTWISTLFVNKIALLAFLPAILMVSCEVYRNKKVKETFIFIYPTISMIVLLALYKEFGVFALLWLILVVSFTDIFAYFTGKSFGKRQFSSISPNKTWEGVIGGVLAGTIIGSFAGLYFGSFTSALLLSFAVSFFSVFGDLFESYLKREAEVKDSGNILPGHGGVLDRLDGYLFGVIILYAGLQLL